VLFCRVKPLSRTSAFMIELRWRKNGYGRCFHDVNTVRPLKPADKGAHQVERQPPGRICGRVAHLRSMRDAPTHVQLPAARRLKQNVSLAVNTSVCCMATSAIAVAVNVIVGSCGRRRQKVLMVVVLSNVPHGKDQRFRVERKVRVADHAVRFVESVPRSQRAVSRIVAGQSCDPS
jgi:hypothetical protein